MSSALQRAYSKSIVEELGWKHETAHYIKTFLLKDEWGSYYKFAIIRSPWEIIESFWRHTKRLSEEPIDPNIIVGQGWLDTLDRFKSYENFDQYVVNEYLNQEGLKIGGGFWGWWCNDLNGNDLGINPIMFDDINNEWEKLSAYLGIKDIKYPRLNYSDNNISCPIWSKEIADEVGSLCWYDIQKFNFKNPV